MVAIAMRSVGHSWRALVIVVFYSLSILGCGTGALYAKLMPNMYVFIILQTSKISTLYAGTMHPLMDLTALSFFLLPSFFPYLTC